LAQVGHYPATRRKISAITLATIILAFMLQSAVQTHTSLGTISVREQTRRMFRRIWALARQLAGVTEISTKSRPARDIYTPYFGIQGTIPAMPVKPTRAATAARRHPPLRARLPLPRQQICRRSWSMIRTLASPMPVVGLFSPGARPVNKGLAGTISQQVVRPTQPVCRFLVPG
jgi:hypothetical protein